jgi:HrpA-like RNA helicase
MILDAAVARDGGASTRVLVTQPRRVAAMVAAARVAAERGEAPLESLHSVRSRRSVGYTVHLQSRAPRRSPLSLSTSLCLSATSRCVEAQSACCVS